MFKPGIIGYSAGVPNGLLNDLISYYKSDTNGSFPDAHGSNNGTINGATYTASGKINGGYDYDGSNDYVSYPALSLGNNFTFNFWFTTDTPSVNQRCTYHNNAENKFVRQEVYNSHIRLQAYDGTDKFAEGTTTLIAGTWYMGTFVYVQGGTCRVYLNGIEEATLSVGTFNNISADFGQFIGCNRVTTGGFWNGKIDEFGVWNKELTPTEITALYKSGNGLSYSSFTT